MESAMVERQIPDLSVDIVNCILDFSVSDDLRQATEALIYMSAEFIMFMDKRGKHSQDGKWIMINAVDGNICANVRKSDIISFSFESYFF